jgi:hypothetical protein
MTRSPHPLPLSEIGTGSRVYRKMLAGQLLPDLMVLRRVCCGCAETNGGNIYPNGERSLHLANYQHRLGQGDRAEDLATQECTEIVMIRNLSIAALSMGLGVGILGCQSNDSGMNGGGNPSAGNPSGTPAQTPQGNMQGPAHSNGTEGADTAQNLPPVSQSPNYNGTVDQRMANQGRLPTTQPQP